MLTGRSWLELPFPCTFQNGYLEKNDENKKNGNFPITVHNYSRITMFMSMYMFLRETNTMKLVLNSLL